METNLGEADNLNLEIFWISSGKVKLELCDAGFRLVKVFFLKFDKD